MSHGLINFFSNIANMWPHIGPMVFIICLGPICGDISKVLVIMDQVFLHDSLAFPHLDFNPLFIYFFIFFISFILFYFYFFGLKIHVHDSHPHLSSKDFGSWWQLPLAILSHSFEALLQAWCHFLWFTLWALFCEKLGFSRNVIIRVNAHRP